MELQAHGAKIHYERTGKRSRRVALSHGWGCDTSLMKPVADALGPDMRVLSIDFPGHGQSGRPPEPWGVPEYAAATLDALRKLDFLPCAVIAHSFGGRVAAYLASEDAGLFTRMILTGAAGGAFNPSQNIQRSEVSAIMTRMFDASARKSVTL